MFGEAILVKGLVFLYDNYSIEVYLKLHTSQPEGSDLTEKDQN
ncbi:hypothetical protein [Priestia aryabhattai]